LETLLISENMYPCPHCKQDKLDLAAGRCLACGALATEDTTIDQQALAGLLTNVQLRLFELKPHEFQQILGVFSERIGHDESDGIPFTDATCRMTHAYLKARDIICVRIDQIGNGQRMISLVVAPTVQGIERCLRLARKATRQARTILKVDWGEDLTE
jgi:hypothetical protein